MKALKAWIRDNGGPEIEVDVELDRDGWPLLVRVGDTVMPDPESTCTRVFRFGTVRPPVQPALFKAT